MQSLAALVEIAERPSRGPSPSFHKANLVLAFITIGESRTIGRQALALQAGLNEGPVRTVIKRLREEGYIETNASGCFLTRPGERVYNTLRKTVSPLLVLDRSKLTMGKFQAGLAVRGGGRAIRGGLEQRDSAVKIGAAGATTYVISDGKFAMPGGSSDCERDFPSDVWRQLRATIKPRDGDAVILCGAEDATKAKLGALSAALTIL